MNILSTALGIYVLSLVVSLVLGFIHFLIDIHKWKDREEPVYITPSQYEDDLTSSDDDNESEVKEDAEQPSEHHTPIVF